MNYSGLGQLEKYIQELRDNENVLALFFTGSYARGDFTKDSDLDFMIILRENTQQIKSFYKIFDGHFADVFVYDLKNIEKLEKMEGDFKDDMDGVFMNWLKNSEIVFDKDGVLDNLKKIASSSEIKITDADIDKTIQKISYNYYQNSRYYESGKREYRDALEIRLLYSVVDIVVALCCISHKPWNGEKNAIKFICKDHAEFYNIFKEYQKCITLEDKFTKYKEMYLYMTKFIKPFDYENAITVLKDGSIVKGEAKL